MSDKLALIERVIEEHRAIRKHVKLVGDSVADGEALSSLAKARADIIPGRQGFISEEKNRLQQTISSLDEGLHNHFAFEEEALPPVLGESLTKALIIEHQEIRKEIDEAKKTIASIKVEGLTREEILSQESQTQAVIDHICQLIEEHAVKEEGVLDMLRESMQEEAP